MYFYCIGETEGKMAHVDEIKNVKPHDIPGFNLQYQKTDAVCKD